MCHIQSEERKEKKLSTLIVEKVNKLALRFGKQTAQKVVQPKKNEKKMVKHNNNEGYIRCVQAKDGIQTRERGQFLGLRGNYTQQNNNKWSSPL